MFLNVRRLIVISTGGTIDKSYDKATGCLKNTSPLVKNALHHHLKLPYTQITWVDAMRKDSLEFTDLDRQKITTCIQRYIIHQSPIVVLHGTDTMQKTAQKLISDIKDVCVPIVLTGAMKPFGYMGSDALQNVTEALLAAKILQPGVYIAFHNHIFDARTARKNYELMTFENNPCVESAKTFFVSDEEPYISSPS